MTARARGAEGQVLVLFALSAVALFGFASLAIDVGRFYSEERYLQNAVDAAALGAGRALTQGASDDEAIAVARSVLLKNLAATPNGGSAALPPETPVYADGSFGDAAGLVEGILISNSSAIGGCDVRVAARNPVGWTFAQSFGLDHVLIGARARVTCGGGAVPIAVKQSRNGTKLPSGSTCTGAEDEYVDYFSTANTACWDGGTTPPSEGGPYDPARPEGDPAVNGPALTILGVGAQPNNEADFRGFVALDIRDFRDESGPYDYYNGVSAATNANTLKEMEGQYICSGYPGPYFPVLAGEADPDNQVATIAGNSTAQATATLDSCKTEGDVLLVMTYSGSVMDIPDFAVASPGTIKVAATGVTPVAGSFKVSKNQAFGGVVTLSTRADAGDPANPMVLGTMRSSNTSPLGPDPVLYAPLPTGGNPVTPSLGGTTVEMRNIETAGAAPGIYTVWIDSEASSPYLTKKRTPVAVKVGAVTRDFSIAAGADRIAPDSATGAATFSITLTDQTTPRSASLGGVVALSVDPTLADGRPIPAGFGARTFSSAAVSPAKNRGTTITLTIPVTGVANDYYTFVVRARTTNGDGQPVTRLLPVTVAVGMTGATGNKQYVDVTGYALMRVSDVQANYVSAYAISPIYRDPNDRHLRLGQEARLYPWD